MRFRAQATMEQLRLMGGEASTKRPRPRTSYWVSVRLVREKRCGYAERPITTPELAAEAVREFLADMDREVVLVLVLDTKHRLNAVHVAAVGTLNSTTVHPREVFKVAILANAAAVIVAHNHPSGDPTPSREDIELTERLAAAGKVVGIEVLDHLIIGGDRMVSLRSEGAFL